MKLAYSAYTLAPINGQAFICAIGRKEIVFGLQLGNKHPHYAKGYDFYEMDLEPYRTKEGERLFYSDDNEVLTEGDLIFLSDEGWETLHDMLWHERQEKPKSRLEIALEVLHDEENPTIEEESIPAYRQPPVRGQFNGIPF